MLLVSALALVSCSQEDVPGPADGDGNRVLFRTSLPEVISRAEVIYKENLPHFYVTAFDLNDLSLMSAGMMQPLFAGQKVNVITGNDTFSSPYCCWPETTKESDVVSFFGFYPGLEEMAGAQLVNASTAGNVDYRLKGFRVESEIADQLDFVTAYTTGTMADNLFSGITLPFAHQLSRIEIKAYGAHKSCDIEIAGVRIGGTGVEGTFDFKPIDGGGVWTGTPTRDIVEYVYRKGDKIFSCGKNHPVIADNAVSIMGSKRNDNDENCAMLIPSKYDEWDYAKDPRNDDNLMYISVLLRVTDATPTAGQNPVEKQRFPYRDLSQGVDALKIPIEYMAVNKATGEVSSRLYKKGDGYFTDAACTEAYTHPAAEEIREFGWAALPVKGDWQPGKIYTYTLDYTLGVGLHGPEVTTGAPGAGDPVISDRVGLTYTIKEWKVGGGDEVPVPGS